MACCDGKRELCIDAGTCADAAEITHGTKQGREASKVNAGLKMQHVSVYITYSIICIRTADEISAIISPNSIRARKTTAAIIPRVSDGKHCLTVSPLSHLDIVCHFAKPATATCHSDQLCAMHAVTLSEQRNGSPAIAPGRSSRIVCGPSRVQAALITG